MLRIGFAGPPASGKTVLAKRVSSELSVLHKVETNYCDEYASIFVTCYRDYLVNGAPSVSDQFLILQEQIKREDEAEGRGGAKILINDSPIILNFVYASRVVNHQSPIDRIWLGYIHDTMIREKKRYDLVFVAPPRMPDATSLDTEKRVPGHLEAQVNWQIHQAIIGTLSLWQIPHIMIEAHDFDNRVKECVTHVLERIS